MGLRVFSRGPKSAFGTSDFQNSKSIILTELLKVFVYGGVLAKKCLHDFSAATIAGTLPFGGGFLGAWKSGRKMTDGGWVAGRME